MNFPEDNDRQRKGPDDFLQDYVDMQHTFQSLSVIDQILMSMDEKDKRRALLYQLRRQLQEDEITFEEARRTILELESALEKVTGPANRIGTLLEPIENDVACITVGGSEYYANVDARIDPDDLAVGTRVLVNEAFAVVGSLGYQTAGVVAKISDVMEDGRLRVGQEQGTQSTILLRSSLLADQDLKVGEEIRVDPSFRVAIERIDNPEVNDYYLEDIPDLPWDKIGGQDDAIQAIKDTIEMPVLHPELFERFQYSTPKGFLLYGPPGCGKTRIGKATAFNLALQAQQDGNNIKQCFMHIKGPEILNMWLGESERKVREIFARAREKKKEGYLPVVFIDEAESILGTRRANRSHSISSTVVPMFCAEMDGIDSLQDVVLILASNRPDLIDPAILRPGRIDRKIKVTRPGKEDALDILKIYLTPDLPIDPAGLEKEVESSLIDQCVHLMAEEIFARRDDTRFLEVTLRSGRKDILHRGDLCSGAVLESIVRRAKEYAILRSIASGSDEGIALDDLMNAVATEYGENEIFPPNDSTDDWLKLLDYEPENVAKVSPIRPDVQKRRSQPSVI